MSDLRERLRRAMAGASWSARKLSIAAGLSESFVADFLRDETRSLTVNNLQALAKVLGVSAAWLISGQSDNEPRGNVQIEPWTPPKKDGQRPDIALRQERLLEALAPGARSPAAYAMRQDFFAFGLFRGDVLVIDMNRNAEAGDLVLATTADLETGAARTELRRFFPPYLLSPDPHEPEPQLVVDGRRTVVMGPVMASFRAPQLAA